MYHSTTLPQSYKHCQGCWKEIKHLMSSAYGFARMPRIIRKGYKELSKLQKLLYIYLRDICGENGLCYRSLRTLADETDFSIGYLSENIPLLEQAGLIVAEKKKHNNHKWEIWHISIVDIWQKNTEFMQSQKCSPDEQISDKDTANRSGDEQIIPQSVHDMNINSEKCSRGATKEEKKSNENQLHNKKEGTNPPSLTLTSEEQLIYDLYSQIGAVVRLSETTKNHCAELAPHIHSLEDMKALYAFVEPKITGNDKTVYLGNMVRYLRPWLHSKTPEQPHQTGRRNFTQERIDRELLARQAAMGKI